MDAAYAFSQFVAETRFEDLPREVVDVAKKFWDCSSRSVKPIPDENKRTVIDMVKDLEKVKDVAEIMRLIS